MRTYLALFRGINVGGNNILPMKDLVQIMHELGYINVKTHIQSGNLVFTSQTVVSEKDIEKISSAIMTCKSFKPQITLLSNEQINDAINNNHFQTTVGKSLHFFFLQTVPTNVDIEKLNALKGSTEEYKMTDHVFYLYAPDGIGRSKLAAKVENVLGVPVTARNWNTVAKIKELMDDLQ